MKNFKDKNGNLLAQVYTTSEIVANPQLSGNEPELQGVQIGDQKYKAPQGGGGGSTPNMHLYSLKVYDMSNAAGEVDCAGLLAIVQDLGDTDEEIKAALAVMTPELTWTCSACEGELYVEADNKAYPIARITGLNANAPFINVYDKSSFQVNISKVTFTKII